MRKYLYALLLLSACFFAHGQQPIDSLPGTAFDPVEATMRYINQVSPAARQKSDAYFEGGYWFLLWDMLYAFGVAIVFLFFGLSAKLKQRLLFVKNRHLKTLLFAFIYFLLVYLLVFPIHLYESFIREHQYGLSNLSFAAWLKDDLIQLLISSIALSVVTMVIYIFIQKAAGRWWVWTSLLAIAFMTFVVFISPVFLDPIFNDYKPLAASPLKEKILSLARANQVPAADVFMFNASKQSDRISANVNGLGSTTRIALNDNLLNNCSEGEVLTVMGHEMGHYAMHHLSKMLIEYTILFFILFFFTDWGFRKFIRAFHGTSVEGLSDIAGLPLIMGLITFGIFLLTPVTNTLIRTQESEADLFGLNAARQPDAEAQVDLRLLTYRKANPGKWEEIIFFDHPSGYHRILMAMQWKAENRKR